jgi:uncharacterized damage-inducible protein DinB
MAPMEAALLESFRHNAWATETLIAACEGLTDEQLDATAPGTFGSVIRTLRRIVGTESWFIELLTREPPAWAHGIREADLGRLNRAGGQAAAFWERFITSGFDPDRPVHEYEADRDETVTVPASLITTLAVYHGSEHRAQVCTVLASIGLTPPELDAWEYAKAAGRPHVRGGPPPRG